MWRNSIRLSRWHEWLTYLVLGAIFVTGTGWGWLHYFTYPDQPAAPFGVWLMKVHGAAAMIMLVVIGTLLPDHVRLAWRAERNRWSGSLLLGFLLLLTISGYGLYYFGGESLRNWTGVTHLSVGLFLPAILVLHIWRGKKSRRPSCPTARARPGTAGCASSDCARESIRPAAATARVS